MAARSRLAIPLAVRRAARQRLPANLAPRSTTRARRNSSHLASAKAESRKNEPVAAVHTAARRDQPLDGRADARRTGSLQTAAGIRAPGSRLPHDPSPDVLSGRESGRNGVFGDRPARADIRTNSRLESNDLDELIRKLDYYAAIRVEPRYRRCRAGSPGGNQFRGTTAAKESAEPADLQQD